MTLPENAMEWARRNKRSLSIGTALIVAALWFFLR